MKEEVFVIGGGPSIKNLDLSLLKGKDIIAVNKAIFDFPTAKYFVTIDFTFLRKIDRKRFNKFNATKFFVANFSFEHLKYIEGRIVDARPNFKKRNGIGLIYDLPEFDIVVRSKKSSGIGIEFNDFRSGSSSGFCGFQLAVLLGYKDIYLLGIDLNDACGETHYHGGYGEAVESFYSKTPMYLERFIGGIQELKQKDPSVNVYSCSDVSKLNNILEYKKLEGVV